MLIMMTMPVVTDRSRRSARRGGGRGGGGGGVFSTPFSYYCVVLVLHLVLLQFCVIFAAGDDVHLQRMTLLIRYENSQGLSFCLSEHEEEDQLDSRMQLPRHALSFDQWDPTSSSISLEFIRRKAPKGRPPPPIIPSNSRRAPPPPPPRPCPPPPPPEEHNKKKHHHHPAAPPPLPPPSSAPPASG
ncbi:unnamed protein product [Sphagnum compactum]